MSNKIQFRRGATAERLQVVPENGEPVWDTVQRKLFIGDGASPGGVAPLDTLEETYGAPSGYEGPLRGFLDSLWGSEGSAKVRWRQGGGNAVTRAVEDKLRETVSVKDFGAVGDGITDDYAAIQRALDYAKLVGGCRVTFPTGVYSISAQLRIYSDTTMALQGSTIRRDFTTSSTGTAPLGVYQADGLRFKNVTLENGVIDVNCDAFPAFAGGFFVNKLNGIDGCTLRGITFLDIDDNHAFDITNSTRVLVEGCKFMGFRHTGTQGDRTYSEAIQLDSGDGAFANHDVTIRDCYFGPNPVSGYGSWGCGVGNHGSGDVAPPMSNIKITGCVFDGCTFAGIRPFGNWKGVDISGNEFIACYRGIRITPRAHSGGTSGHTCEGLTIRANRFQGETAGAIFFDVNGAISTAGAALWRHKSVKIVDNDFASAVAASPAITLAWAEQCRISGNSFASRSTAVSLRFCDTVSIDGNTANALGTNFVWIHETGETARAGQGLTANLVVSNNAIKLAGYRVVHVNCAAMNVTVSNNTATDVGHDGTTAREAFRADSNARNVIVSGNVVHQTTAALGAASALVSFSAGGHGLILDNRGTATLQVEHLGTGMVRHAFTGAPNGQLSAPIGSTYLRTDGSTGATFYVKESGTGNTGWVVK